jgi:hypothetical protein
MDGVNLDGVTLALLLAPGGGFLAASIIRQLVEVLKVAIPRLDARVSGALQAFVLSAVLYTVVYLAIGTATAESVFAAFLGFLSCATSAVGINSAIDHVARVTRTDPGYIPRTDGQL